MELKELRRNWELFAEQDPLFAVISWPEKRGRRWNEKAFFENGRQEIRSVMADLEALPVHLRRRRALDFGCGVGRLTQALSRHFAHVTGVDVSERMLSLARQYSRGSKRCRFIHNPDPDLAVFPDSSFDFVYSNITLQHMAPRYALAYMREFIRVLAPGGVALFQVPATHRPRSWGSRIRQILRWTLPGPLFRALQRLRRTLTGRPIVEMNVIARERVLAVLREAGAEVIEVREDPHAGPEWPGFRYCVRRPRAQYRRS